MAKNKRPNRTGTALQVWLDKLLAEAMEQHLDESEPRVSKTAYVESLIRADLRSKGKWPPKPGEAAGKPKGGKS